MTTTQEPETRFFCTGCGSTTPADKDPDNKYSCKACTHLANMWHEAALQLERAIKPQIEEWQARWQGRGLNEEITSELATLTLEKLAVQDHRREKAGDGA
jgi:hypothetical protein